MSSEVKLSGDAAGRIILQGNDTITTDQTFTFPDTGGEVATAPTGGSVVGYQQGVWTPTGIQGVGTVSNTEWSRIGNQVTIAAVLAGIATGNTGAFVVQGIPYPNRFSGCKGACMSQGFASPPTAIYITAGGDSCEFYQSTSSTWVQATYNMLSTNGAVYFTATYSTDDTTWTPINGATVS